MQSTSQHCKAKVAGRPNDNGCEARCQRKLIALHKGSVRKLQVCSKLDIFHSACRVQEHRSQGLEIVTHLLAPAPVDGQKHRVPQWILPGGRG